MSLWNFTLSKKCYIIVFVLSDWCFLLKGHKNISKHHNFFTWHPWYGLNSDLCICFLISKFINLNTNLHKSWQHQILKSQKKFNKYVQFSIILIRLQIFYGKGGLFNLKNIIGRENLLYYHFSSEVFKSSMLKLFYQQKNRIEELYYLWKFSGRTVHLSKVLLQQQHFTFSKKMCHKSKLWTIL